MSKDVGEDSVARTLVSPWRPRKIAPRVLDCICATALTTAGRYRVLAAVPRWQARARCVAVRPRRHKPEHRKPKNRSPAGGNASLSTATSTTGHNEMPALNNESVVTGRRGCVTDDDSVESLMSSFFSSAMPLAAWVVFRRG
jgi:hypothetical protein